MAEQSHREEMNAAIRAQRERQGTAAPQPSDAPAPPLPEEHATEDARSRLSLARLVARLRGK